MITPLLTWACIVGLFVVILVVRLFSAATFCAKGKHRLVEFGSEREEFFIPGDPDPRNINDYASDDFDDL